MGQTTLKSWKGRRDQVTYFNYHVFFKVFVIFPTHRGHLGHHFSMHGSRYTRPGVREAHCQIFNSPEGSGVTFRFHVHVFPRLIIIADSLRSPGSFLYPEGRRSRPSIREA